MADKDGKDRHQTVVQKAVQIALIGIPIIMYVSWVYKIFRPCPRVPCEVVQKPRKAKKQSKIMCTLLNSLSKRFCNPEKEAKEKYEDPCFGFPYEKSHESSATAQQDEYQSEEDNYYEPSKKSERKKCVSSFYADDLRDEEDNQRREQTYHRISDEERFKERPYHPDRKKEINYRDRESPCNDQKLGSRENTDARNTRMLEKKQASRMKADGGGRNDVSTQPVSMTANEQRKQNDQERKETHMSKKTKGVCTQVVPVTMSENNRQTEKQISETRTESVKRNVCYQLVPIETNKTTAEESTATREEHKVDILAALEAFGEQLSQKYTNRLQKTLKELEEIRVSRIQEKPASKSSTKRNCCVQREAPKDGKQEDILSGTVKSQIANNYVSRAQEDENDQRREAGTPSKVGDSDADDSLKSENEADGPTTNNKAMDEICDQNFHSGDVNTPYVVKDYKCDSSKQPTAEAVEETENEDDSKDFWHACNPPKGLKRGCQAEQCQEERQSAKRD